MIAHDTLQKIEESLKNNFNGYKKKLKEIILTFDDIYKEEDRNPRNYMGASIIGGDCPRKIWYDFRWYTREEFEGRLLRLFNRGHMEEARFTAILLNAGFEVDSVDPADGEQIGFEDLNGHFRGSCDGVVYGLPEVREGVPALLEFKTHSNKSFQKLKEQNVEVAKPQHFVQMQIYMHYLGLQVGLYMGVNKDNDELYGELISYDEAVANKHVRLAKKLIEATTPPSKISESPGWYLCGWCSAKGVCHGGQTPVKNCRSCTHSRIKEKDWCCLTDGRLLDEAYQLAGCDGWIGIK